jgi:phospholipid-translocating ATPase
MSRPHEYHLPNAPDSFGDDPESDLELDANELGPGSIAEAARGDGDIQKRLGNRENEEARQIPLRNLRPGGPRTSRRTRRYEEEPGDDGSGANGGQSHMHGPEAEDASESFSVGDATPLLNYDVPAQPARPRSGIFGGRVHIPGFMSRRSGYTNLSDPDAEAHGEASEIGTPRNIDIGQHPPARFPPNTISNAKYSPWDFLPRTLYNEFSFFINLYFLFVALSQLIPALAIGILWTYMAPLVFVLVITLGKEAFDDIQRRRRDREANKELYVVLRVKDLAKYPVQGNSSRQTRQRTSGGREARSAGQRRMNAIEEEEEVVGNDWLSNIQVDEVQIKSRDLKVGDILKLGKDQRVPADMVILKSIPTESSVTIAEPASEQLGAEHLDLQDRDKTSARPQASTSSLRPTEGNDVGDTFIRTDQLDGETDWKLRMASPLSQALDLREFTRLTVTASKPSRKVNEFIGRLELRPMSGRGQRRRQHPTDESPGGLEPSGRTAPLSIDNTAWANTILASSATVLGVIVYTCSQTRQALSTSSSRSKLGLLELEINNLTKFLCILTLTLSAVLVAFLKTRPPAIGVSEPQPNGKPDNIDFREQQWYISITRFLILFSSIIPISLRVNLDLGKSVYAYYIERDKEMPGAVVRTSTIPEDLGRIEYLLSDKTGTLTQNGMLVTADREA